jgi:hypothetical protein
MAMKKDEMLVLGLAGVAVYMIVKTQGFGLGSVKQAVGGVIKPGGGGGSTYVPGKTPASNYYSPWFGITGNAGYSLFDGALDSLGFGANNVTVGGNKGTGTGLGLKLDNTGLGMSYGGVESNGYSLWGGSGMSGGW